MKMKKSDSRKLIDSLLLELDDAFTETTEKRTVEGRSLIGRQVVKDLGGEPIKPSGLYTIDQVVRKKVDHRQRLIDMILAAKDEADFLEKAGTYLSKYSKNRPTKN